MTTVVSDGLSVAGDSRSTQGDIIQSGSRQKVFPLSDGSIVGMAGRATDAEKAIAALQADPHTPANFRGDYVLLRLYPNGRLVKYEGSLTAVLKVKAPVGIGSGGDLAVAAVMAGATAKDAVRIAAKLDVYSGGKITSYSR